MDMECKDALPLVPAYLDGEVTETRAGLLRKHLLGCHSCRTSAQDGKTLKRWFGPLAEASRDPRSSFAVEVPSGFAARVARRAAAGDSGERVDRSPRKQDNVLPFVLRVTALAAGLLFVLAIGLRMQTRPEVKNLSADSTLTPVERLVEQFDQLNGTAVLPRGAFAPGVDSRNVPGDRAPRDESRRAGRSKQE